MLRFAKSMALVGLLAVPLISSASSDHDFLNTTNTSCVSDGIEEYTGAGGKLGLTPSPKFIALLGFAVQRNYRDADALGGLNKENYLRKMIEIIQADGFCLSQRLDGGGVPTTQDGYGGLNGDRKRPDKLSTAVMGFRTKKIKDDLDQSSLTTKEVKEVVKYFGFDNEDDIKALFFDNKWSSLTPAQRQAKFNAAGGSYSSGLQDCVGQMKRMQTKTAIFNHNGTDRSQAGIGLCKAMANRCDVDSAFCTKYVPSPTDDNVAPGPNSSAPVPAKGGGGGSVFDQLGGGNSGAK